MTTQPHLWKLQPSTYGLTPKQELVMSLLQASPDGLRSSDLGRALHLDGHAPCACSSRSFCKWAMSTGESVGKQLRAKDPPLAIKRKSGKWESLVPAVRDTGELPEGF